MCTVLALGGRVTKMIQGYRFSDVPELRVHIGSAEAKAGLNKKKDVDKKQNYFQE